MLSDQQNPGLCCGSGEWTEMDASGLLRIDIVAGIEEVLWPSSLDPAV